MPLNSKPDALLLELKGLTKRFPGVVALNAVDLSLAPGEIHALVGENGAGKSTLIKLLCGSYVPDAGEMQFDGAPYRPESPLDALKAGIRVVYQEFSLLPYLSVAENLLFDSLPRRYGLLVDYRKLHERARALLERVGLDVDPQTPVEHLGVAQCQLLEIGKALSFASRLLILDEPTATLTPREIGRLFGIIRDLRASGVTVIYVSHHLNEIFDLCDAVTVLRNGRRMVSLPVAATSPPEIVHLMVGRELEAALATHRTAAEPPPGPAAIRERTNGSSEIFRSRKMRSPSRGPGSAPGRLRPRFTAIARSGQARKSTCLDASHQTGDSSRLPTGSCTATCPFMMSSTTPIGFSR